MGWTSVTESGQSLAGLGMRSSGPPMVKERSMDPEVVVLYVCSIVVGLIGIGSLVVVTLPYIRC